MNLNTYIVPLSIGIDLGKFPLKLLFRGNFRYSHVLERRKTRTKTFRGKAKKWGTVGYWKNHKDIQIKLEYLSGHISLLPNRYVNKYINYDIN